MKEEVSLLYSLLDDPFFSSADKSPHAVQDAAYACAFFPSHPVVHSLLTRPQIVAGSLRNISATASAHLILRSRTFSTSRTQRTRKFWWTSSVASVKRRSRVRVSQTLSTPTQSSCAGNLSHIFEYADLQG